MTEKDNDARWQMALDLARDSNQSLIELRKMIQRGFEEIARSQVEVRGRVTTVEADVKAIRATQQDHQQRLVRVEAEGTARAVLMRWLLLTAVVNAAALAALLVILLSALTRLFSVPL